MIGTNLGLIPFSVWAEEVSKIPIFNYYDIIVKDVIMIIYIPKRTQVTILKLHTCPDCKGINSRAFLIKVKNRPKLRF